MMSDRPHLRDYAFCPDGRAIEDNFHPSNLVYIVCHTPIDFRTRNLMSKLLDGPVTFRPSMSLSAYERHIVHFLSLIQEFREFLSSGLRSVQTLNNPSPSQGDILASGPKYWSLAFHGMIQTQLFSLSLQKQMI